MVDVLFGPEVRQILERNDAEEMKTFCEELHPATVASALEGEFEVDDIWRFLQYASIQKQADIFAYFPIEWQVKMVEGTGRQHMAKLIEQMSSDDRAELLRKLDPAVTEGLLRLVDEANRKEIAALVKYPEGTAGALMTTEYAWLPENITTGEALDRLRLQAPDSETIYYIYVLDDQRRLNGVVSLRDLILAPRTRLIREIMNEEVFRAKVSDDREQVAQLLAKYDLLAVPVVDEQGRLVGIITHDDVIDVVVQEATEDVHRMGGVGPLAENYLEAPFLLLWRNRAFWLSLLFLAELFTFTALASFEDAIAQMVVLSLFVPLCISTGGNSGSQAATLITRAIALGQIQVRSWLRVLRHELMMGVALGITLGSIGFLRGWATPDALRNDEKERKEAFQVLVPRDLTIETRPDGTLLVPAGAAELLPRELHHAVHVSLPEGQKLEVEDRPGESQRVYQFPAHCRLHTELVTRWGLGWVVGISVTLICLWGTMVGSMLPLIFKSIGVDPGIASSPFVATFVDVTGIMIYFSIASVWLL